MEKKSKIVLNQQQKRVANVFLAAKVLESFGHAWMATTYVLFLLDRGLSLYQANLVNVVFMITIFVTDPLTGYLGDKLGHRKIYIAGLVGWAIGFLLYFRGNSFWQFALAEFFAAIGYSLLSDALESWAHKQVGNGKFKLVEKRSRWLARLAGIPTALVGSVIGQWLGFEWPWLLASVSSFVTALICVGMFTRHEGGLRWAENTDLAPRPSPIDPPTVKRSVRQELALAITTVVKDRRLAYVSAIAMISSFIFQPFNMFWAPVLNEKFGNAGWLGLMWVGITCSLALGHWLVDKTKGVRDSNFGFILLLTSVPMLLACILGGGIALAVGFLIQEVGRGLLESFMTVYRQEAVPMKAEHLRNTVSSTVGSARTLANALGLWFSGWLSTFVPIVWIWTGFCVVLVVVAIWCLLRKESSE